MSRYRKVSVRMWGDEKFRQLSPLPPSGQSLWLFLICGPVSTAVPGMFRAGRAALAEELRWSVEAFDKAFEEAFQLGMVKADWEARVVWVPKAIEHNKPESPNVVKYWASEWELVPECELKREALESIKSYVCAMGEGFAKAFGESFGKALPKTMPNHKHEHKHKHEQEQVREDARAQEAEFVPRGPSESEVKQAVMAIKAKWPPGCPAENWITAEKLMRQLVSSNAVTWAELERVVERYAAYCRATSRLVANPGKWFADLSQPWLASWALPKNKAEIVRDNNIDVSQQWLEKSRAS